VYVFGKEDPDAEVSSLFLQENRLTAKIAPESKGKILMF
jgi:hypothetical protein